MTENEDREAESEGAEATEEGASGSPDSDTEANSDDEQPEIADNERADMPEDLAEVAADVEAEAGANSDTDDDQEDSDDASSEDTDASTSTSTASSTSTGASNWGDLYCDTVVAGLNTVVEEYGHEDADPIDESLPRDLDLDHYVDEWMAQQGKAEMEPGEGIVVGTTVLALTVLTTKTDLPNQALNKAKSQSDDA